MSKPVLSIRPFNLVVGCVIQFEVPGQTSPMIVTSVQRNEYKETVTVGGWLYDNDGAFLWTFHYCDTVNLVGISVNPFDHDDDFGVDMLGENSTGDLVNDQTLGQVA